MTGVQTCALPISKILKESENNTFNVVADRLTYFPTLQTILDTSQTLIKFDPTKCIPTKISADFFIYSEDIKVIVFLAIREINTKDNIIICCPISFLVDRADKLQKDKQKHIKIKKLKKEEK